MLLTTTSDLTQELNQTCEKLLFLATGKTSDFLESPASIESTSSIQTLDSLCQKFGLSESERQVLLLCIAAETIPDFYLLCTNAQGNVQQPYPTLALCQKLLPNHDPQLLSSNSALQQWQLIQFDSGSSLAQSPIRIDPAILSYILGYPCLDTHLTQHITPLTTATTPNIRLPPSQENIATELLQSWIHNPNRPIQLTHPDTLTKESIALTATTQHHHQLYKLHHLSLPTQSELLHTRNRPREVRPRQ